MAIQLEQVSGAGSGRVQATREHDAGEAREHAMFTKSMKSTRRVLMPDSFAAVAVSTDRVDVAVPEDAAAHDGRVPMIRTASTTSTMGVPREPGATPSR